MSDEEEEKNMSDEKTVSNQNKEYSKLTFIF